VNARAGRHDFNLFSYLLNAMFGIVCRRVATCT
jgi:hypothetical protein